MKASNINKFGKKEKNKKILEGDCVFPFKYKWEEHNHCATSVNDKKTLKTFGYCKNHSSETVKKSTKKKALAKTIKVSNKKLNKEEEKIDLNKNDKTTPMNQDIIKALEEYAEITLFEGEFFKSQAYKKAAASIEAFPEDIVNVEILEGKKGIGKQILEKKQ